MTANQLAYDRVVHRAIALDAYEKGVAKKIDTAIDSHISSSLQLFRDPRMANADPTLFFSLLDRNRSLNKAAIHNTLERSLGDLYTNQADYQKNTIDRIMGKFWNTQSPELGNTLEFTRNTPLYFGKTFNEGLDEIFNIEQKKLKRFVSAELTKDSGFSDIANKIEKKRLLNLTKTNTNTLAVTTLTATVAEADKKVFDANTKVMVGWQYVAILDLKTSDTCRSRAGRVFRVDQKNLYPPAHYNCRSIPLPLFKSLQQLADEADVNARMRNILRASKSDKAKHAGEPAEKLSYDDWLAKQSPLVKLKQLGSKLLVDAVESKKVLASEIINLKSRRLDIQGLRLATNENSVPGASSQFANAKAKLDALRLNAASPDDFINDKELVANLKEYYKLQSGELNGTLSLTNYRGQLINVKSATKRRVLSSPPTEAQQIFNPFTGRYEDARMYRPNPYVYSGAVKRVLESKDLLDKDRVLINSVLDDLSDRMGVNERAAVADNMRILFERYRRSKDPWGNFKAVAQSQIKFDVMNVSEALETRLRKDADFLKKFMQDSYIDPVLGDVQLQELHDSFISNILKRNTWEDRVAPKIANDLRNVFDYKIPLKIKSRLSDEDLQQFYLRFAHRLALNDGPDRDQFAVQLGRDLYNLANYNGDKNSWFDLGRDLLESKNVKKFIELDTFGVQKRRLKSKLSNKYFGPYYDTLSFNIRTTDKRIQEYSRLNRKIELGLRIGVTTEQNRLILRPGYKTYFIDRGILGLEDSRIPITSTSSYSDFPESLVDADLARALNWASNAKYKIEPTFYNFSKKLLYFKDDKGRAEYFEDLNAFKKHYVSRGDSYERFKAMDWLAEKNVAFSNQPFVDHRLRIYDRGLIGPQSGESFRPFLSTEASKPLGVQGYKSLADQVGSFLGGLDDHFEGSNNSLTINGRYKIFQKWQPELIKLGNDIIRAKPDNIRSILESEFASRVDGEELGKLYRLALETAKIDNYLKGAVGSKTPLYSKEALAKLDSYLTDFAIEQDASSSGAQIIALTTKNRELAELSNVVQTNQKRRLYDEIAARTFNDPAFIKLNEKLQLTEKDLRKAAKAQNMVTFYGAGERTGALNVEGKLAKVLEKEPGVLVVKAADRDRVLEEISARAARYERLVPELFDELKNLRKIVKTVFDEGLDPGDSLMDDLYFLNEDSKALVDKMSGVHEKVVTPSDFRDIAKLMSGHLAEQVPITKDFTKFLGELAADFLSNAKPSQSDFDWSKIAATKIYGSRERGFTLSDDVSRILGLKPGEPLSEKLLKRFGFWEPEGTLANIILGEKSPKFRRTGAKYLKTEFLGFEVSPGFEVFTANKLPKSWTNVPWVNFDGKVIEQNFTQIFETRLTYKDADGNWVKNILQVPEKTSATWWEQVINKKGKINDVADLGKARTAYAVNGNHSNDATLVKNFHLWGADNKIATSTIHDAFFTNIADMVPARKNLRKLYSQALKSNVVGETLKEMRARGLPEIIYKKKLEQAIEMGLIPTVGKTKIKNRLLRTEDLLKSEDILKDLESDPYGLDLNWYGVG